MLRSYLKVALRNLLKYKTFSFINAFGLALAMSAGMMVILMLADQKRYDEFHNKKNRIYRILSDRDNSKVPSATSPFALSDAFKSYPVVEETTHLTRGVASDMLVDGRAVEFKGYFSDPAFFKVFDFVLQEGNPATALSHPNSIVITASFARKVFNDVGVVGKTIELKDPNISAQEGEETDQSQSWGSFTVTGVMEDDKKSHLLFDALVSSSSLQLLTRQQKTPDLINDWQNNQSYTYVLLADSNTDADVAAACADLISQKSEELKGVKGFTLIAQRLTEITPGMLVSNESRATLPGAAYYFLAALALIILLSACLNYANLSIARAMTRAKEIGVRKVTGALRRDLVYQFLSEAMITSCVALVIASALVIGLREALLQSWINQHLGFDLAADARAIMAVIGFALMTGVVAGIYPAVYLSKFQPVSVLKSSGGSPAGKISMRKVLAIVQFVISMFFITTSLLLVKQFRHFMHFEYGFDSKNIVNVELQGNDYRVVTEHFKSLSGVSLVSACNYTPSTGTNNGIRLRIAGTDDDYQQLTIILADENFITNLGIDLVAGRNLPIADTSSRFVLINEAGARYLGFQSPSEIVGEVLTSEWDGENLEVVGLTDNFFVKAPLGGESDQPILIRSEPAEFAIVNVRVESSDLAGVIAQMERAWKSIDPTHAFKYALYDDELAEMHAGFFDLISLIGFIAIISITIACLGLLGMSTYLAERKKKEVSIRKVLGADAFRIVLLLSRDFVKILFISVMIGAPMSFFINDLWLQHFPNRVPFGVATLGLGAVVLLIMGLITIGSQTIGASRRNPVEALKVE